MSTGVGCPFILQVFSWPRDWTRVSHIAGRRFTIWATREPVALQEEEEKVESSPFQHEQGNVRDFLGGIVDKNACVNAGHTGLIPGLGRFYLLRSN